MENWTSNYFNLDILVEYHTEFCIFLNSWVMLSEKYALLCSGLGRWAGPAFVAVHFLSWTPIGGPCQARAMPCVAALSCHRTATPITNYLPLMTIWAGHGNQARNLKSLSPRFANCGIVAEISHNYSPPHCSAVRVSSFSSVQEVYQQGLLEWHETQVVPCDREW